MDKNNQLETAPIGKLVFKLAIPTVMAQLVNLLYNIVDRIYVGRIPEIGSLSLAGLGVTFPIILLVSAFAMLAGMGGASRAAVSMGEKDNDKAEKILGNCTMLLIIFSVVLAVVFMLTKNQILMKFGASEATLPYASDYISIYLVGTIFVQIALGLNLFITNQGFAKTSMMTVCIGAVLNIVLDPIFIYVFGMGVKGAALATIISQGVSCLWVLKFLTGKKTILKIRLKNLVLDGKIVTSVLSLGVSPFIMQATECLIQLTFNNGMLKYGNDLYVALMSILFSLTQLIWMPLNGFSQGAQPVIGYNYGAKEYKRVNKIYNLALMIAFACGCADDAQVREEIRARYEADGYLCDTHTAVAFRVARQQAAGETPCVVLSTASPYKFPCDVLGALGADVPEDEFEAMRLLQEKTGVPAPASLAGLREKPVRFTQVVEKDGIRAAALAL